jgi:hypothetical protein
MSSGWQLYPITARDLAHAASLFALWKARRIFGPRAICAQVILQEEIACGGQFEVRLFSLGGAYHFLFFIFYFFLP